MPGVKSMVTFLLLMGETIDSQLDSLNLTGGVRVKGETKMLVFFTFHISCKCACQPEHPQYTQIVF